MAENNGPWPILQSIGAANDDLLAAGAESSCPPAPACDDPCGDAGYDANCRDCAGDLCPYHEGHCRAPDFPCLDLLRHRLALEFLEELAAAKRM